VLNQVGVRAWWRGDPQLGIKDSHVNIFSFLCVKFCLRKSYTQLLHVVCVFLCVIPWFKVVVNYNKSKRIGL
jgi:hypothetical protein